MLRWLAIVSALALGTAPPAGAQDHGRVGLTAGYPGDVGVLWHASDSIAIRPSFTFTHSSGDSASGGASSGWASGVGVSALFYVKKYDNVRTYVSPQFTWSHGSTALQSTAFTTVGITSTNTTTGGGGAFGAQYTPSAHFAVYGEAGVAFSHQKTSLSGPNTFSSTGNSWGTFAGVGVVFYP